MARYKLDGTKLSFGAISTELEKISVSQEDFVSRIGETPNQMESDLDMNNKSILNLPTPTAPTDVVRLQDIIYPSGDVLLTKDLTVSPTDVTGVLRAQDAYAATSINFHTGHAPDKSEVGLENVDNTSDVNKPVSTAQSTAIGLKADTTALTAHTTDISNPHSVTQTQVGLSNVNNTSDANKPVSTATQTALDLKASTTSLNTHINDAANPHSVTQAQVGLGNVNNTADADKPVSSATQTALDLKANTSALTTHVNDVTNPHAVTKTQVGLSNVDNTSDANKPVSTAQQAALDLKADRSSLNRQSLLDNPLCHLFKTNKLVDTSAPTSTDSDITFTRASTATYVDRYGIVKTAAVDTIREEKEGFLIEGASTNIIVYSEQFDNGAWPKSNINVTANATTAPDGTTSADLLTGVANTALTFQQKNIANSTNYTFSLFVKNSTLTTDSRLNVNNGSVNFNVFFNLVSGTITSVTAGFEGSIKTLDNGWFRVTATFLSDPSASIGTFYIVTSDQEAGAFYAWGAQIEDLGFASSYIPTVATAVTRLSDGASVVGFNNATRLDDAFSISATYNAFGYQAFNRLFNFGTSNFSADSASVFYNSTGNIFYLNGTDTSKFNQNAGFTSIDFALTYDNQIGNMYVNGVGDNDNPLTLTGASTVVPNKLVIGGSYSGFNPLFGHVKDFRFYDFALNANEVEYLSQ